MIHTDGVPTIAMRASDAELIAALDQLEANRDPGDETTEVESE